MTAADRDNAVDAIARVAAAGPIEHVGGMMSVARRIYLTQVDEDRKLRLRIEQRDERDDYRSREECEADDAGQPMRGEL